MEALDNAKMDAGDEPLILNLTPAQLKAMGLEHKLPQAGAKFELRATATMQPASDEPDDDGDEMEDGSEQVEDEGSAGIELVISKLELLGGRRKPADQVLYGSGD